MGRAATDAGHTAVRLAGLGDGSGKGLRFVCSDMWQPYLTVMAAEPQYTNSGEQTANMLRFCLWFSERAQLRVKDVRDVEHSIEV
jgi:hypothetical protein